MDILSRPSVILCLALYVIYFIAQTEGDNAYDYADAYDDPYDGEEALGIDPKFDVPLVNVTVVAGQTAMLPCSIKHLGNYKVSWTDQDFLTLTLEDRRVVDDSRFSIVRSYINEWNLQIRNVQWSDQGAYQCAINTKKVGSKTIILHVKVPPRIIDELSSNDETVQEGDTVVLICNVTGVPKPEVTWYRKPVHRRRNQATERKEMCKSNALGPGIGPTGEMIIIKNVSRYCDDIYECHASNNVQPDVSRSMRVTVEFPPEVTIRTPHIWQTVGKETILECKITAYPQAVNVWRRNDKRVLSSLKHHIEAFDDEETSTISLNLHIKPIEEEDYGEYTCVAMNALGEDKGKVILSQILVNKNDRKIPTIIFQPNTHATEHSYIVPRPTERYHGPEKNTDPRNGDGNHNEVYDPVAGNYKENGSCSQCTPQLTLIVTLCLLCLHYVCREH